jgi:hypothetical protein
VSLYFVTTSSVDEVLLLRIPVLGNHEAWGVRGKLCMSQNNHTVSILTGCAGDGKPLRKIGKPLKKAVEENRRAVEESGKPLKSLEIPFPECDW